MAALVLNVWPHKILHDGQHLPTDGLSLLRLTRNVAATQVEFQRTSVWARATECIRDGDHERAATVLEEALEKTPDDWRLSGLLGLIQLPRLREEALARVDDSARVLDEQTNGNPAYWFLTEGRMRGTDRAAYLRGSLLVDLDRLNEVVALSEERVAAATDESMRALWEACLALGLVLRGRGGADLVYAEGAARRAFEALPWVSYVTDAWGMVLIEQGKFKEGLNVFHAAKAYGDEPSEMRLAWSLVAYVALGRRGSAQEVREFFGQTRPDWPAVLRRIEAIEL